MFLSLYFAFAVHCFAQNTYDIIYMKDSSIFKGTIIEEKPGVVLKFKSVSGETQILSFENIERIVRGHVEVRDLSSIKLTFKNTQLSNMRKWTYDEKPIAKMQEKELKQILLSINDKEVSREYKLFDSEKTGAFLFSFGGGFLIGWTIGKSIDGDYQTKFSPALAAAGGGLILISIAIGSSAQNHLKNSIRRYNQVVSPNTGFYLVPNSVNGKACVSAGIHKSF